MAKKPPKNNSSGMSNDPVHDASGRSGGGDGSLFGGAPPPPPSTKSSNKHDQYIKWASQHGIATVTANDIWYWSHHTPNVDPYLWSSVLLTESGAKHLKGNGAIVSSGQAVGIGQIALSWIGQPIPWDKGHKFTGDSNPKTGIGNYGVNLRMSAYLWGSAVGQVGWQKAYTDPNVGYNSHDPKKGQAWAQILKTYQGRPAGNPPVGSPSQGPADTTATQQTGGSITTDFKDPYITGISKGGKFSTTNDPNRAIQYDGRPMARSDFLQLRDQLTSYYVSYTGNRPTNGQILQYVTKGWNPYRLETLLSHSPNFTKSPIYKQYAGNFNNDPSLKDMLPKGKTIDPELMRQAIVNQWSASTIATKLRASKEYVKSNEFKGRVASLLNAHSAIMGTPDPKSMVAIKDAALQGWDTDQYAAWLRSQPFYTSSPEYKTKALTLLSGLGLITGSQVVMAHGVSTPGTGTLPSTQTNPADPRIKGDPRDQNSPLADLGVTLSSAA